MDTVTLTIDGQQVTVPKGTTLLQAAIQSGHEVPYYCYHPGLGIDGSCRVCLVKIEKMGKLQTACSTYCSDGMIAWTNTPEVVAARASVFEFLLINHRSTAPSATRAASARCSISRTRSARTRAGWICRGAPSTAKA
jgi:NADH-quinone oxidoreductase subunit G